MTDEMLLNIGKIILQIVAVFVPIFRWYKKYQALKKENRDYRLTGIQLDLEAFNGIRTLVDYVYNTTKADRFLILIANNGKTDMRFASAIYEQHKQHDKVLLSIGATGKYVRFEFDSNYRDMLKNAEINNYVELETTTMPDSDLKSIYLSEKVVHSKVYFLMRKNINKKTDRILYCTFATHDNLAFTVEEKIILHAQIDKLRTIINSQ